jgi:hypothetical protein
VCVCVCAEITGIYPENHKNNINSFRIENRKLMRQGYNGALYGVRRKVQFCSLANYEGHLESTVL